MSAHEVSVHGAGRTPHPAQASDTRGAWVGNFPPAAFSGRDREIRPDGVKGSLGCDFPVRAGALEAVPAAGPMGPGNVARWWPDGDRGVGGAAVEKPTSGFKCPYRSGRRSFAKRGVPQNTQARSQRRSAMPAKVRWDEPQGCTPRSPRSPRRTSLPSHRYPRPPAARE